MCVCVCVRVCVYNNYVCVCVCTIQLFIEYLTAMSTIDFYDLLESKKSEVDKLNMDGKS